MPPVLLFLERCDRNHAIPSIDPLNTHPSSHSSSTVSSFWSTNCPRCKRSSQSHQITALIQNQQLMKKKTNNKSHAWEEILCQVFCEIRNYRVKLTQQTEDSINWLDSFPSIDKLKLLKDQNSLLSFYSKFNELKCLNLSQKINRFHAIIILDECYHQLYYYISQLQSNPQSHSRHHSYDAVIIPPPHEYFSYFLYSDSDLNSSLQQFITTNFNEDYKRHISEIWGLVPSSPSPLPHSLPFEDNPLLRLHFSRWRETIFLFTKIFDGIGRSVISTSLTVLRSLCLENIHLQQHHHHQHKSQNSPKQATTITMRLPHDPLLPTLHRLWFDSIRVWSCHLYAYATPTPQAIDALIRCTPLVEVGAGTGYWTKMIQQRAQLIQEKGLQRECEMTSLPLSLVIQAFDKDPTSSRANSYHGRSRSWTNSLSQGNANDSIQSAYRRLHGASHGSVGELSLFLCYPPPDSDMALQSLRQYMSLNGTTVCYVGEYRGDTGTKSFEKLLESSFHCVQQIELPNWGDTSYNLTIWKINKILNPKQNANPPASPPPQVTHPNRKCRVCGQYSERVYRCRISYAVSYCSENCALSPEGREIYTQELSYRCLYSSPSPSLRLQVDAPSSSSSSASLSSTLSTPQPKLNPQPSPMMPSEESSRVQNNFESFVDTNLLEAIPNKNKPLKNKMKRTGRKRKIREKLRKYLECPNTSSAMESKECEDVVRGISSADKEESDDDNDDSAEDIRTQLKKYRFEQSRHHRQGQEEEEEEEGNVDRRSGRNKIEQQQEQQQQEEEEGEGRIGFTSQWFMVLESHK